VVLKAFFTKRLVHISFAKPLGIAHSTEELHTALHVIQPKVFERVQVQMAKSA
jgi:hypothetical protein